MKKVILESTKLKKVILESTKYYVAKDGSIISALHPHYKPKDDEKEITRERFLNLWEKKCKGIKEHLAGIKRKPKKRKKKK